MLRTIIVMILLCALCIMGGCENTKRSMVFFTGTTLGVEVAFEPNSTAPARFIVGYKRAEGLMDPVMEDKAGPDSGFNILAQPHSVLAKIAGEVKAGKNDTSPSLQGAQWFASGKAAELLAANPLMAAALVNDVEASTAIADAVARSSLRNLESRGALSTLSILNTVYEQLKTAQTDESATAEVRQWAKGLMNRLNEPEIVSTVPWPLARYRYDPRTKSIQWVMTGATESPFESALNYLSALEGSIIALTSAIDAIGNGDAITDSTNSLGAAGIGELKDRRDQLEASQSEFLTRLLNEEAVIELLSAIGK